MNYNTRKNNQDKGISFSDAPYIHYSPPRVLDAKRWARGGDVEKLQQAALFGQGHKLLGIAAPGTKARAFLRDLPNLISKCETLHTAVTSGSLRDLRNILDKDPLRKRLSLCRDRAGVGLLHKAVYYDFQDIIEYLVQYYPQTVLMRDSEGRTPLHYAGTCSNPNEISALLINAGAEKNALDLKQKTPSYYINRPPELRAHIPQPPPPTPSQNSDLVIKPSNIRIWCHDRDLGRLQQVVWKGQGGRLITEVSSQPAVKKFLEAVPHIMVSIRDIHTAAIENDLDKIKNLTQDPIPPIILSSQDVNGLTALHKAAGMGSYEVAKYIVTRFPESVAIVDNDGKTPLHWSALPKDERTFNVILQNGAEEGKLDSKMKSAGYYKNRPGEIDKSLLSIIPEAPRVASSVYPTSWDWNLLKVDEQNQINTNTLPRPIKKAVQAVEKVVEKVKTPPKPKPIIPVREDTTIPVPDSPIPPSEDHFESYEESENLKEFDEANNNENLDNYNHDYETSNSHKESGNTTPSSQEYPRPGTATINRVEGYDDAEENGLEIEDDEDYQEKIELNDRNKTAVLDTNHKTIPSSDHDDDDVQVRGENESDYGDVHNAETADVLDVEDMKRKKTGNKQRLGSEDVIEGVINADPEVDSMDAEQLENNDSNAMENMDDDEVQNLIDNGNMEQLAALVLNGEGERLVGQMSTNPELQAFLDNIPSYMGKIQRVHLAAKSGALREMQSALDRRKFATARDKISPGGATPLHVSVLFGRTAIVRYLATRFPETLSAVDFEGRTPLHYAAALKDNGHYFNMLVGLGANPKDQDENGHTAEEYLKNTDKYLNQKQLLKTFGADDEFIDEMLNDKDNEVKVTDSGTNTNGGNGQVDIPIFRTEEGRYLATSLGDPLIKGLTEVANTRPKDPIAFLATYLYNFANQNKARLNSGKKSPLLGTEPKISGPPNGEVPIKHQDSHNGVKPSLRDNLPPTPDAPSTPGIPEAAFSSDNRDEHGQSMLHFAAARGHARGALLQLVKESSVSPAYRDELYRTARDVSIQANLPENTKELDRWLLDVAATGDTEKMNEMILEGYDHILDVTGDDEDSIIQVVTERGQTDMLDLLNIIQEFEEIREQLHQGIRESNETLVHQILTKKVPDSAPEPQKLLNGKIMAKAKNAFGRCSLHIAVLAQQHDLVEFIARTFPETLRIGDNLERTALHYAMGVDNVESTSRILIKAGAKRVLKDLKGRQPSYYFMNKSDILRLKEEEESY